MHFIHPDTEGGTYMAHFQTTWDLLRPRLSNPRTRKLPTTSAITDCMSLHNFKKGIFGLNLVLSINVVDWCHFFFPKWWMCHFWNPSVHKFHVIKAGSVAWLQDRRQCRKAAQRLLNSCSEARVCATLWIIYCWKHSHSTEHWCQMQSGGDKTSLLCWDGRHVDNIFFVLFFCCYDQRKRKEKLPSPCSSLCTIQLGCNSMHAKCKTLHSLAFLKTYCLRVLAIALLSSDSFVMHYCTCLYLEEVTF